MYNNLYHLYVGGYELFIVMFNNHFSTNSTRPYDVIYIHTRGGRGEGAGEENRPLII